MKRVYTCLLLFCMLLGMLAGCGSEEAAIPAETQTPVQEEQPSDAVLQPETEPVLMAFNPEDGSNNINNNCFTLYPDSYTGSAKTAMISDGESLYVSVFINEGRSGIFKCALTDTDLSNAQMVFIPDVIAEETFPIALGFLDSDTLCAVAQLPDEYHIYGLYEIAADGSTTGTAPEPYCTVKIEDSHFFQPKIVGNYLYYTALITPNDYSTYALMRLHLSGEQEPEELLTYQGGEEISAIFDGDRRMFSCVIGSDGAIREHDLYTGEIREHLPVSASSTCILKGYHEDCVYYRADSGIHQLSLVDGAETLVVDGLFDYAMNFGQDAVYVIEQPFLYRIPYSEFGGSTYPHMDLNRVSPEKFSQYEAGLISGPLLATYDPCLWFWNGQLWTFYAAGDWSNTLHVLPLDQFGEAEQTNQEETAAAGGNTAHGLSGMYYIGQMSDDAPAIEFSPDTETIQVWNFDLDFFTVSEGTYLSSRYTVTADGFEVSFPFGNVSFQVTEDPTGFMLSRDGNEYYFEKWG